jgi:putative ABC transport system permease protein
MLKNYFKTAWRNIKAQKMYSLINIAGLSAGIAFTFLMIAYVWQEVSVNKNLSNIADQYIIQSKWKNPDMGLELTTVGPLAKSLKEQYPHLVANYYRWDGITAVVSNGDKIFREGLQIGDSTLLAMYGFELLHGDKRTALNNPFSVVITASTAKKYFGKTDVVGATISIENFARTRHTFLITGVLKPTQKNAVIQVNDDNNNQFFLGEKDLAWFGRDINQWANAYILGYIQLQKGVQPASLNAAFQQLLKTNAAPDFAANLQPFLVPLKDYYLEANNGRVKKMLYTVSFISLFILLMAIINFINVCISRSATRMREIGIRKVLGSLRKQLVLQFMAEAYVMVAISAIAAMVMYELLRPWFGNLLGTQLVSIFQYAWQYWTVVLALILVIGLLSGIYPALVLSSLEPIAAVSGKFNTVKEKVGFRKFLVGFQFGTAAFVLIAAIIVANQTNYFFKKDWGFNRQFVITAQLPRDWSAGGVQKIQSVKKQLLTLPQVQAASIAYEVQDGNSAGSVQLFKYSEDSTKAITAQLLTTDEDYSKTYAIALKAGNYFTHLPADTFKLVINEANARALGYTHPQDAIGQMVKLQGSETNWIIGGVTADFHFGSLQAQIKPVVMMNVLANPIYRYINIKLKPGNMGSSIAALQKKWAQLLPATPFEYNFMDDKLAALYKQEMQLKKAGYAATGLSMIIVLLGVIGLVALSVQKRIKEIGIRKIMGASSFGIVKLFVQEFLLVMMVAVLITCPVIYYVMQSWLNGYAYRINLSIWPFITGIAILACTTIVLIALQTIKTAWSNPVNSLRTA